MWGVLQSVGHDLASSRGVAGPALGVVACVGVVLGLRWLARRVPAAVPYENEAAEVADRQW